ncbi:MAG TPA: histidine kinase [Burkholderiaceae bacterium]|nr:histidine kinase [Burkholderiaceae bacterium]
MRSAPWAAPPLPATTPAALRALPAPTVLAASLLVALLLSTEYLFQPFVWRNWPVDEVMLGWLEVLRDRIGVAVMIGVALVAASRVPARTLPARSLALALAIVAGAAAGEWLLLAAGARGASDDATAVLGRIARWAVIAGSVGAMWFVWQRGAEASAQAQALELRRAQLERQAIDARLGALRGQIDPHFLFNTLATVRRLQQIEPERGARLLAHFVAYLRSAQPQAEGHRNTLGQEIDLTRAYLGVVEQRMQGRLQVRFDVPDALRTQSFPPLTIATLVENAVKHGIGPAMAGGAIEVSARRSDDGMLEAVVADTGVGFGGATGGSGIGLANIRSRLTTLYGSAGTLSLHGNRPSGVRAVLRMPAPSAEHAT